MTLIQKEIITTLKNGFPPDIEGGVTTTYSAIYNALPNISQEEINQAIADLGEVERIPDALDGQIKIPAKCFFD